MALAPPLRHWRPVHTVLVILLTTFFVWMAVHQPWGLFASWVITMSAVGLFTMLVGHGVTGALKGALVDDRLRVSLSRLQMLTWTAVIIPAFGVIAIARTGHDPVTALDVSVPSTVWWLLGISTTSLVGSPVIRDFKADAAKMPLPPVLKAIVSQQGIDPSLVQVEDQYVKNTSIDQASFADLFMGELVDDFALLDVSKMQMFFFTLLAVLAYGTAIAASLRSGTIPDALPDVSAGLLAILGISHGGYLATKMFTSPRGAEGSTHTQER